MPTTRTPRRISKHELKTDAFTTMVFAAKEWAEANLRMVVMVAVGAITLIAAVWGFSSYLTRQEFAAQRLFGEAGVEIRSENPTVAIALLRRLVDEHSGAQLAGPATLQLAQLQFQDRSFDEARLAYQAYLDDHADDPRLVAASWAGLGAIEEQAGFPDQAVPKYQQAIDADPGGFQTAEYLRRLIRAAVAADDTTTALGAFETMENDFSDDLDNYPLAQQLLIEHRYLHPGNL